MSELTVTGEDNEGYVAQHAAAILRRIDTEVLDFINLINMEGRENIAMNTYINSKMVAKRLHELAATLEGIGE